MKKIGRFLRSRRSSGEAGQALILVMIFLILGSLTLVPTLTHISTAIKTGEVYEKNTDELYTADSGIEDSLWRIKYDFLGAGYNPYDFNTSWPYQTEDINGMAANFTISNVWFPTDVTLDQLGLDANEAKAMMESEKLVVAGSALPGNPYRVLVSFVPDVGDNLTVKSLGVWMPRGFNYADNCTLQVAGHPSTPVGPLPAPGGTTMLWKFNAPYPLFTQMPNFDSETMSFDFTFSYTEDNPNLSPIAWITTGMNGSNPDDVPVSWDIDTRYYKMVSTAGDTVVEAYSSKNELRQMGDAMSGDYVAIGNSLLSDDNPKDNKRETWHTPGTFNLQSIPADADAVYAYLYWSGWRNQNAVGNVLSDDCSNLNNWVRTNDVTNSQTSVPVTPDGSATGTWTYYPASPATYWDKVDETNPNDNDYIKGTTLASGSAYRLFNFSPFSIPSGATISDVTIYARAEKLSGTGTPNIRAALKINGGSNPYYSWATSPTLTNTWATYSFQSTTNPKTGVAWTATDLNSPSSTNGLQQFGVYSTSLTPNVQVSMVYARVNYYIPSRWTISSNQFQGQGTSSTDTGPLTITLKNPLNLGSYGTGIFNLSWTQTETGNLQSTDTLYYAFSSDNGTNWSQNYKAFSDDDPATPFSINIPSEFTASHNFKMRFYFNFNSTSKYVYLDDIKIVYLPVDTGITFKIGNDQVYFDGSEPAVGAHDLTATRSYAMLNTMWGDPYGFSYACVRDVSALVKTYPIVQGEEHHTGNALYSVGGVTADVRNPDNSYSDFACAGWSLIIVYASPESAGHYIYIRDNNFAFHPGTGDNLDWDQDGLPGGKITNFKVPDPIKDKYGHIVETLAAKITTFVVEGDAFGTSSIVVTGKSGVSKNLTNPTADPNDVFNGKSYPGTFNEGVDVDTFQLNWSDNVLTPGDKELQVDLFSLNDAWNLVYFIISIRSETQTGGTGSYLIHGT